MPESLQFTPLNPNVVTRKEFTENLVSVPVPSDANPEWKDTCLKMQSLYRKLAYHEAMAPNFQQTYMTPANSKNRVYFMWDFVGRTLAWPSVNRRPAGESVLIHSK
jgi:hypothetical protein